MRYFKKQFADIGLMHVGQYQGNLKDGFILKDVWIKDLPYFPDSPVRVQEIRVHFLFWDLLHPDMDVFNARIFVPQSDPLVFTGKVHEGEISGNIYGGSMDLHEACRFWGGDDINKHLQGFVAHSDFIVRGQISSLQLDGSLAIDKIEYKQTQLTNIVGSVHLNLMANQQPWNLWGDIIVDSGHVNVRGVNLQLDPGKLIFNGEVFNPVVDIHLSARVEDMDIHLAIRGLARNPQMAVTSDPPMSTEEALQVLFTGNAWTTETTPFNGIDSSQLAQNFLNYTFQPDTDDENFGLKTKLTKNLKLGVEMDQLPQPPGEINTYYSRKINGEMDLSDHMSLNVSQELYQDQNTASPSAQDTSQPKETQVYLQYKKRF